MAVRSAPPADRARLREPALAAALRHAGSCARPRSSARRARRLRIRSCSIGSRASFVESGWDIKALNKLIVMSATFRQDSDASAEQLEQDPDESLARARRRAAPAGRDDPRQRARRRAVCSIATIGGPSVYPYQPERRLGSDQHLRALGRVSEARGRAARSASAQPLLADPPRRARAVDDDLRFPAPAHEPSAPADVEHAAAGARAAQRSAVRRSLARARAARDACERRAASTTSSRRVSGSRRGARRAPRELGDAARVLRRGARGVRSVSPTRPRAISTSASRRATRASTRRRWPRSRRPRTSCSTLPIPTCCADRAEPWTNTPSAITIRR